MNTILVIERHRNGVIHYMASISVEGKHYAYSSMSEAGVRTWLARQGIPFKSQPELTIQGGKIHE